MYVCVSVCVHARDHNFYSIDTTFGTLVGLVNSKVQKMGYMGPLETLSPRGTP